MNKRKTGLIVVAVAGVLLLVLVGRWLLHKQATQQATARMERQHKQAAAQARVVAQTRHQLYKLADSLGIDTSRYAREQARLTPLLLEMRYGRKPSNLAFTGLNEQIDSSWARQANAAGLTALRTTVATFAPYKQLLQHYVRLRKRAPGQAGIADSLRLIRQTLNFYRYINRFSPEQFVLVNIPAGELTVFDKLGSRLLPMKVIAGKPDRRTPCMTTYIQNIVAYPYWNVPQRIALEEILPHIKRDIAYLYNQNFQVLDEKNHEVNPDDIDWNELSETNFPYRIRQASGCDNSLGLLKFELANPLAIYLHDTNSRDLFVKTTDHWRSHGCVRVQKPVQLANLVLGEETFDDTFMEKCKVDQKPQVLRMARPFPVFITYNLADVDAHGNLRFYKDVYGSVR